jgi:hypothetical protein
VAEWTAGMEFLSPVNDPCLGFKRGQWSRVRAAALAFLDQYGNQAHALGWSAADLFGVHPEMGMVRVDSCGALMLTNGVRVVAVSADAIGYANGLVYRRRPMRSVPVWEFEAAQ